MSKFISYILNFYFYIIGLYVCLVSCNTQQLPAFSRQQWHVDSYSGNAVSTSGLEVAFGCEWMITDTTLIQTDARLARYPKLSSYLAKGLSRFPEIEVDSVLFYNPDRVLLFFTYHQVKPLKPSAEICLYDDTTAVYSPEYARIFGHQYTYIDETGWEGGPTNTVYANVCYRPKDKQLILLQRIPFNGANVAVLQMFATRPKGDKWVDNYPPHTLWALDFGNLDNIVSVASLIHSSNSLAVDNLRLAQNKQK